MRKHQRRNTYDQERASAAVVRRYNAPKRVRTKKAPKSPELVALLEHSSRMTKMQLRGEVITPEIRDEYRVLLDKHHASMKPSRAESTQP